MFISNSSQTNSFYHRIFLILRSPLRSFHSLSKIFQKIIEWFTRVNFLSHDINFNFFLSDRPITFSLILIFSTRSSSWSIFQFHDSIVSKEKKKKNTHSKEQKKVISSRKNPRFPITLNRSSKLGFSFRRGRITVRIRKFSHVLGHGWNV